MILKDICDCRNVTHKLRCFYVCHSSEDLVIFSSRISSSFSYFCVIRTSVIFHSTGLYILKLLSYSFCKSKRFNNSGRWRNSKYLGKFTVYIKIIWSMLMLDRVYINCVDLEGFRGFLRRSLEIWRTDWENTKLSGKIKRKKIILNYVQSKQFS